jgi:hypothetical protein
MKVGSFYFVCYLIYFLFFDSFLCGLRESRWFVRLWLFVLWFNFVKILDLRFDDFGPTLWTFTACYRDSFTLFYLCVMWDWFHLLHRPLIGLLYQPRMIDVECGAVGGIKICRRNRSTRRKRAPVRLYPPQTRSAAVGSRRLTTWVVTRP